MSRASRAKGPVRSTLDIGCLTGMVRGGMNDPEVTMSNAANTTNLVASTSALEAAGIAIKLVLRVPAPLKSIAMAHQLRTISRDRLGTPFGVLANTELRDAVRGAIRVYLDLWSKQLAADREP
jgi:mRNA-degrading endonuclease toxin of MazEF toxin-antitoxin module